MSNCLICKKENKEYLKLQWKNRNYVIYKCDTCGILYNLDKTLKVEQGETEITEYEQEKDLYYERFNQILDRIYKIKSSGDLLDIGSSIGYFLDNAKKRGYNVAGVETEKWKREYSIEKFNLKVYENISQIENKKYDIIVMLYLIEHIRDINNFINKIKEMLKIDGIIVIETVNYECISFQKQRDKWKHLRPDEHKIIFSEKGLEKFLKNNGFSILQQAFTSGTGLGRALALKTGKHYYNYFKFIPCKAFLKKIISTFKPKDTEKIFLIGKIS